MIGLGLLRTLFPPPDWRRTRVIDAEIDEEFAFHRAMLERELLAAGRPPAAAAQEAAERFGDAARLRSECRNIMRGSRNVIRILLVLAGVSACIGIARSGGTSDTPWAKLAPFTAVRWTDQGPEIEHEGRWFTLLAIDGISTQDILAHCAEAYSGRERKRFSEDIVEVLSGMGHKPGAAVELHVRDLADGQERRFANVPMSPENRAAVWTRNAASRSPNPESRDRALQPGQPDGGALSRDNWARLSPFTAVRWNDDLPEVQIEDRWYALDAIDGLPIDQILDHCRAEFPGKEQKRFSEDLVEVLATMGHAPAEAVALTLADLESGGLVAIPSAAMTAENRARVRASNRTAERDRTQKETDSTNANAARAPASDAASVAKIESEWEGYTRRFIERYHLDKPQTAAALRVLKRCQSRGQAYLRTRAEAFKTAAARTENQTQLADLRRPIDEIFEKQLKPGLERLPTRRQRTEAGE